jgi:hypothetical protein
MRPADPYEPDTYLLDELALPRACVSSGRITIWVYLEGNFIREIVLSGHAESETCRKATTTLIDGVKHLPDHVRWMLTCGAAFFRVPPEDLVALENPMAALGMACDRPPPGMGPEDVAHLAGFLQGRARHTQQVLGLMLHELREFQEEIGLVEVIERDYQALTALRSDYVRRIGTAQPLVVLPHDPQKIPVADYIPIVPGNDLGAEPLVFTFEGWEFDGPAYQKVADRHLHQMQRELLRDALRRRRTYRSWLKEWTEEWVRSLSWLPKAQAAQVTLIVPPALEEPQGSPQAVDVPTFLNAHVSGFLEQGQDWPRRLAQQYSRMEFGRMPDSELDRPHRSEWIEEVDPERCIKTRRRATDDDPSHTQRQDITQNRPSLISHCCLHYIRRMDAIIKPYEHRRLTRGASRVGGGHDENERELRLLDELSRQIVIETMIRGWPSFYLDSEQDRAAFDVWAEECRPRFWAIMAEQVKRAGVGIEPLLEDNIVYDVHFNRDLGCTVQPLMLIDDAVHVQVHGSRVGASAVIPLWNRRVANPMPDAVLKLGSTNSQRAAQLVRLACQHSDGTNANFNAAVSCLRLALACHPAEAGYQILREWSRRLGRDTQAEFIRARSLILAVELCDRHRYSAAGEHVRVYLAGEPEPVPDAHVLAAACELAGDRDTLTQLRQVTLRIEDLSKLDEELTSKVRAAQEQLRANLPRRNAHGPAPTETEPRSHDAERVLRIRQELERLAAKQQTLIAKSEEESLARRVMIRQALDNPESVSSAYPALASAAAKARDQLSETLETNGLRPRFLSDEMSHRYRSIRVVVEILGLLDIASSVSQILHGIDEGPEKTRRQAARSMARLAQDVWLPPSVEDDMRTFAEEFSKGEWDRVQTNQIRAFLRSANEACLVRMKDLLSEKEVAQVPLAEALLTRIHLVQTFESKYQAMLTMLLEAQVPFGRAVRCTWTVENRHLRDFPAGGRFHFDAGTGVISVDFDSKRVALLRTDHLEDTEADYITKVLADPDLPSRLAGSAPLAEALLGVEIEPGPGWRLWRDAMEHVRHELLLALSNFGYRANLLPDHAIPLTRAGQAMARRMDVVTPRTDPKFDWRWTNRGEWQALIGQDARCIWGTSY